MTASILLLALTRHLTQDVAPVPFLWVLPLSIYLLSFILCFDAPRYYYRPGFLVALPIAFLALDQVLDGGGMPVPVLVSLLSLSLFVFCMVCHGELVRRRPPVRHLTLFYLMLSIGGALGGSFVGLLAPALFNAYFELPIGLFLCALLVIIVLWREVKPAGAGCCLSPCSPTATVWQALGRLRRGLPARAAQLLRPAAGPDVSQRKAGAQAHDLHGRINHGEQFISPSYSRRPTAYYCEQSGIGQALLASPATSHERSACLVSAPARWPPMASPGDEMRMYEINEQVLDLARKDFTYLADSPARIVPVLGDGRLMLEREAVQNFDLLAIDAFSGDSIPTHLLTIEAMQAYLRHLKSDGVLAVHITNRYLDLRPVVAGSRPAARHDRPDRGPRPR
jgi:hypothetical protein